MPRESVPGSGICSSAIASGHGSGLSEIRLDSWLSIENYKRASDTTLQLATSLPLINILPDDADKSYPSTPFFPVVMETVLGPSRMSLVGTPLRLTSTDARIEELAVSSADTSLDALTKRALQSLPRMRKCNQSRNDTRPRRRLG